MSGVIQFKFRHAISFDTVLFDGHFIAVGEVKRLIAEKKGLGKETSVELVLSDPRTGEEYKDDSQQLPRNTSVLVRRCPPQKQKALQSAAPVTRVAAPVHEAPEPREENNTVEDEFGADPFAASAGVQAQYAAEWEAINSFVAREETNWRSDVSRGIRGRGGRGGRGGGRGGRIPPPTYTCFRCQQTGHYINDCPTNDDTAYDVKRVRQPVGIPVNKLSRNAHGGLLLPGGDVGSLIPNESIFAREVDGLPTAVTSVSKPPAQVEVHREDVKPVAVAQAGHSNDVVPTNVASVVKPEPAAYSEPEHVAQYPAEDSYKASPSPQPADEYNFHKEEECHVAVDRLFADFDDEVTVPQRKAAPLSLGMDVDVRPEPKHEQSYCPAVPPPRPPAPSSPAGALPVQPSELSEHLPFFQDLLPRGNIPLSDVHRAFFSRKPLTPLEFEALQLQSRRKSNSSRELDKRNVANRSGSKSKTLASHSERPKAVVREPSTRPPLSPGGRRRSRLSSDDLVRTRSKPLPARSVERDHRVDYDEPERKPKKSKIAARVLQPESGSEPDDTIWPASAERRGHKAEPHRSSNGRTSTSAEAGRSRDAKHDEPYTEDEQEHNRSRHRQSRSDKREQGPPADDRKPYPADELEVGYRSQRNSFDDEYEQDQLVSPSPAKQPKRSTRSPAEPHVLEVEEVSREEKKKHKKKHKKSKKHKSKSKGESVEMSPQMSWQEEEEELREEYWEDHHNKESKSKKRSSREQEESGRRSSHYQDEDDARKSKRGGRKIEWKPQPAPDPNAPRNPSRPKPEGLFTRAIAEVAGGGLKGLHKSLFQNKGEPKSYDGYGDGYDEDASGDISGGGRGASEGVYAVDSYGEGNVVKASKRARLSVRD